MKYFKTITYKLSITSLAILFAAGCATVTDANADLYEETTPVISIEKSSDTWDSKSGDDMDPIIEKPDMGE